MATLKSVLRKLGRKSHLPPQTEQISFAAEPSEVSYNINVVIDDASVTQLDQLLSGVEEILEVKRLAGSKSKSSCDFKIQDSVEEIGYQWMKTVRKCHDETQGLDLMKEMETLLVNVLRASKQVHWVFVGISIIGWVLMRLDQMDKNFDECFSTMEKLLKLCKDLKMLLDAAGNRDDTFIRPHVLEGIALVLDGAAQCSKFIKMASFHRFATTENDKNRLAGIRERINNFQLENIGKLLIDIRKRVRAFEVAVTAPDPAMQSVAYGAPKDVTAGVYEVGLETPLQEVINMMDLEEKEKVVAVVLHGMGGIGKSKLAGIIYTNKIPFPVSNRCYIELGRNPDRAKLLGLQNRMIEQLTNRRSEIRDYAEARKQLGCSLQSREEPLLILIDNVLDSRNLADLLPERMSLPKGSRLLVTSRGKSVGAATLTSKHLGIDDVQSYDVACLGVEDARRLLCLHAFDEEEAPSRFREVLSEVVDAAGRLPLAIEVVGKQLRNRPVIFWKSAVELLRQGRSAVQDGREGTDEVADHVLRFSYEHLSEELKKAFALVSNCLLGFDWSRACSILQAMGLPATSLENLESLAIVKGGGLRPAINEDVVGVGIYNLFQDLLPATARGEVTVQMHDLFIALGNRLANVYECISLHTDLEIDQIMSIGDVECMKLTESSLEATTVFNFPASGELQIRVLRINSTDQAEQSADHTRESDVDVFKSRHMRTLCLQKSAEDCVFKSLRWLQMEDWSLVQLPEAFASTMFPNLRYLRVECPRLEELPDNLGLLTSLQVLSGVSLKCRSLPSTMVKLSNLRELFLAYGWNKLKHLPPAIGELSALELLPLDCRNLKSIPREIGKLSKLRVFRLQSQSLRRLPSEMSQLSMLETLLLYCRRLPNIPQGMDRCSSLRSLIIYSSQLTDEIRSLTSLELLCCPEAYDLSGISQLSALKVLWCMDFHPEINLLKSLEVLYLQNITQLDIGPIPSLKVLTINESDVMCPNFVHLPALRSLTLYDSHNLSELPLHIVHMPSLRSLTLSGCKSPLHLPPTLKDFTSLTRLDLTDCNETITDTIPHELRSLPHLTILGL